MTAAYKCRLKEGAFYGMIKENYPMLKKGLIHDSSTNIIYNKDINITQSGRMETEYGKMDTRQFF